MAENAIFSSLTDVKFNEKKTTHTAHTSEQIKIKDLFVVDEKIKCKVLLVSMFIVSFVDHFALLFVLLAILISHLFAYILTVDIPIIIMRSQPLQFGHFV